MLALLAFPGLHDFWKLLVYSDQLLPSKPLSKEKGVVTLRMSSSLTRSWSDRSHCRIQKCSLTQMAADHIYPREWRFALPTR